MARLRSPSALLVAAVLLAACGSDGKRRTPENQWTWVDVPGAVCSDGSGTGIAVNRGKSDAVVLFLDGGGACWDVATCFGVSGVSAPTAKPGPYGRAQFEAQEPQIAGTILDRALPGNPYADATLVFVPYCTGDVHAGDATQTYPGAPGPYRHKGRVNLGHAIDWLDADLAAPAKVVVSGASAGGFGALLAFDLVKQRWPTAKGYLVDDSGPPLVGDDFNVALRAAWFAAWRLDETVLPLCPTCASDLSDLFPTLSTKYPGDRLALLSSTQDAVIRTYVALSATAFETAIRRLATDVVAPLPNARTFLVPGQTHTMLGTPLSFTAGGVPLTEWLRLELSDDAAWQSAGP
jgi:hypothetical protein